MNDVYVYRIALPAKVRGITVVNDDASYTVYINSNLSPEMQAETEAHERYHIDHDHLYAPDDITRQESMAVLRPEEDAALPPAAEPAPRRESVRCGFVRRGGHLLYWERLSPGQHGEEIRDGDVLKRVVPCRTRARSAVCADVTKH
jgi:hypothetical protein